VGKVCAGCGSLPAAGTLPGALPARIEGYGSAQRQSGCGGEVGTAIKMGQEV